MRSLLLFGLFTTFNVFSFCFGSANPIKPKSTVSSPTTHSIILAGGCFWCLQPPFDELKKGKGVIKTEVGYSGGKSQHPTYDEVSAGKSGHLEVIKVTYDPNKINLSELFNIFWRNVDPFDSTGQFCDKGEQYTSAIFFENEFEKKEIENSVEQLKKIGFETKKILTRYLPRQVFYPAEDYHQDYYLKNPIRYKFYRGRCGRDARLEKVWGKFK